eukprot:TRINITY_DN25878_c1_g2_i1.p1 TRINITY_DN25878_c1_g2~~TRINITY_DN25878_c1_g2_i1.p1  ORF type:complete len:456 (-),score=27.57 TRINITY_DN25878_c1_g2_i1:241-1608(-)
MALCCPRCCCYRFAKVPSIDFDSSSSDGSSGSGESDGEPESESSEPEVEASPAVFSRRDARRKTNEKNFDPRWGSFTIPAGTSGCISMHSLPGPEGDTKHVFEPVNLLQPMWCAECDEFLAGLWHQGQSCRNCGLHVCHACAAEAPGCCEGGGVGHGHRSSSSTDVPASASAAASFDTEAALRARIAELEQQLAQHRASAPQASSLPLPQSLDFKRVPSPRGIGGHPLTPNSKFLSAGSYAGSPSELSSQASSLSIGFQTTSDCDFVEKEPLFTQEMDGISARAVEQLLGSDTFLEEYFKNDADAVDMVPSRWKRGVCDRKSRVRGFNYRVPVPSDLPAAARKLARFPDFGDCSALARMNLASDGELLLTLQFITSGFPLSDTIRLQITNSFVPYSKPSGNGVRYRRWLVILWVKDLPWSMSFAKKLIVSQVMDKGRASAALFAKMIAERAGKRS